MKWKTDASCLPNTQGSVHLSSPLQRLPPHTGPISAQAVQRPQRVTFPLSPACCLSSAWYTSIPLADGCQTNAVLS